MTVFFRSVRWLVYRIGPQTVLVLLLLSIVMVSVSWTLADLVRGLNFSDLLPLAVVGLLLGWFAARLQWLGRRIGAFLLVIVGLELAILHATDLETQLLALLRESGLLLWQLWWWPATLTPPQPGPLWEVLTALYAGLNILQQRFFGWLGGLPFDRATFDPVAVTLAWGGLLWGISAWSGWVMRRDRQPLLALLPAGILQATILAYFPRQANSLFPLVAVTLLLMGFVGFAAREERWRANDIDVAPTLRTELAFAIIPIVLVLLILAGVTPSVSIWRIARQVRRQFDSQPAVPPGDQVGLEAPTEGTPVSNLPVTIRSPGLPRSHLLGSGPELSEQVALLVRTNVIIAGATPRFYWRSLTYDRYSGSGWHTGNTRTINYEPGENIIPAGDTPLLQQTVQAMQTQNGLVYAAGELVTLDHPFWVSQRAPFDFFATTTEASSYRASSRPTTGTGATTLETAGTAYPDEIRDRYLNLPDTVPERVLVLARDLTATAATPYDRAKALESYLRQFPYSLNLPEPPRDQDMVDYFLFDLQRGYCDYYATAMVVMARAAGLPARLAVGYASGSYDPAQQQYVVTEADAHSWVEVYFPTVGWVEFEPTAARPLPASGPEPPQFTATAAPSSPMSGQWWMSSATAWFVGLASILMLAVTVGVGWWLLDSWRLGRMSPAATIARLFEHLWRSAIQLAIPVRAGHTPYELAAVWVGFVETRQGGSRWRRLLEPASSEIQQLAHLYVHASYSGQLVSAGQQRQAIRTWQRLRWRLWLLRWISRQKKDLKNV